MEKSDAELISVMENEWQMMDPDGGDFAPMVPIDATVMLTYLKNHKKMTDDLGKERCIPSSYAQYSRLNEGQKKKVYLFWELVDKQVALTACVANIRSGVVKEKRHRAEAVTADEMFRLALLMCHSDAAHLWSLTKLPYDREGLDARQSGNDEVAKSVDPWESLANMFNDKLLPVTNISCKYVDKVKTIDMAEPYCFGGSSTVSFDGIFPRVKHLDPGNFVERDGTWIKSKAADIRRYLRNYASPAVGFYTSEEQNGSNILTQWSRFNSKAGRAVWHDALILTPQGETFFVTNGDDSKDLGEGAGRESDMIGDGTAAARKSREERQTENQYRQKRILSSAERSKRWRHKRMKRGGAGASCGSIEVEGSSGGDEGGAYDILADESFTSPTSDNLVYEQVDPDIAVLKGIYTNIKAMGAFDKLHHQEMAQIAAASALLQCGDPEVEKMARNKLLKVMNPDCDNIVRQRINFP